MKINFIVPEISRTGGMRIIFEYANRLTSRGNDVILYTPVIPFNNYKGSVRKYYLKYQINYAKNIVLNGKKLPDNIYRHNFKFEFLWLFNNFTVRDADAVIATSWTTSYAVSKLNASKGRKFYLIQDYENWNSNELYVDKSYSLPLKRITVSKYLKDLLLRKFNSDSEIILNGIDFNLFNNPDKVFNDPPVILFTDHILENKNTKTAIETAVRIHEKYPDVKFRCFGRSRYHSMPEYIEFITDPGEEDIIKLYCGSDIFLFTSLYEGFGLPPAEAMACRCALAGNRSGAVPEFAEHLKSAMLASPENPDELYICVDYLLSNRDELRRISEEGFEKIRETLDWNRSVNKFEELISENNIK